MVKIFILKWNIFNSYSTDEYKEKNEILSTRIYIIVLFLSLTLFCSFLSFEKQIKTISFSNPSQTQFDELQNNSLDQLQCPCTQISVKYSEFIQFRPTYHQICSSIFVSSDWDKWGMNWKGQGPCSSSDFINQAHNYFYLLSEYCQLSQDLVLKELEQFYVMQYITSGVIQFKQFNSEIKSLIENFKVKTQKSLKTQLNIIQSVIFNNQLLSHLRIGMSYQIQCCNTILRSNIYR
ncbi:unnamed protein product [Adineta ricciae]|uniref:Transmembrane protein n=1 Tax=Adineta ricciae TaxID=249248 RepID=A0A816EN63_ADIRI|nr:unnamed protein product [Adineta ricciae]CAF1650251.1 unnamed protein product [Adineta ricciae]